MKELKRNVEQDVEIELEWIIEKWGKQYASPHEAYGVIAEEFHEARMELEPLEMLMTRLLCTLRHAEKYGLDEIWERIADAAVLGACELIQVAAVAFKAQRGFANEQA